MGSNWFNPNSGQPFDPSTFNYDTAAQQVQRQRAAAQALQALGMQSNQGQFIKSGDFMGYAGGNTLASSLAQLTAAALSVPANDKADQAQKQLGIDSQSALSWALDPNNSPAAQRAAAAQTQREADAEKQREIDRMNNSVQGGDYMDPQVQEQQGPEAMQTSPVPMPSSNDITPLPAAPSLQKAASKALATTKASAPAAAPANAGGSMSANDIAYASRLLSGASPAAPAASASTQTLKSPTNAIPVTGGSQSYGTGADFSRGLAPQTNLSAIASSTTDYPGNASGTGQNAPQASAAPSSTPALSPVTSSSPALPSASPQAPAVQPVAQAPTLEDRARALGLDPTAPRGRGDPSLAQQVQEVEAAQNQLASGAQLQTDPRSMVDQARAQANTNPTFADQMAMLQQVARTGPMGQQLANSMMQSQFSKEWGEIKNADGATIGVYNKRDPNQVMGFQGTNSGTKTMEAAMNMVKNTDYTNPAAMQRLNQNLVSMGQPPMSPQQVAGMQLSANDRVGNVMSVNKAQGDLGNDIVTSKNNMSTMQKALNDAQAIIALSAKVGSKYPGISSLEQLWNQYGHRDPDIEQLHQLYAQNTIEAAREALQGQGRLNKQEYGVFKDASPSMTTSPAAVARLVGPTVALLQNKMETENAILNERLRRYQSLGGDPSAFGQSHSQSPQQGVSTGRTPGNYNF